MKTKLNYVMPTGKIIYIEGICATINTEQKKLPGISKKETTIPPVFMYMTQFISVFQTVGWSIVHKVGINLQRKRFPSSLIIKTLLNLLKGPCACKLRFISPTFLQPQGVFFPREKNT